MAGFATGQRPTTSWRTEASRFQQRARRVARCEGRCVLQLPDGLEVGDARGWLKHALSRRREYHFAAE